ncbi:hypothetical protein BDAP_000354 [Binucleata daphniae]
MNYYNLKDILALEEKFTFKFATDIKLPTVQVIKKNKKVKLPLYLAKFAFDNDHCTLVKDILNENEKKELEMAPQQYKLNKHNYFYLTCQKLKFDQELLYFIYVERMRYFLSFLFNDDIEDVMNELLSLDEKNLIVKAKNIISSKKDV